MRSLLPSSLIVVVLLSASALPGAEAGSAIPPESHPWGRFQPGAWKQVRVITEVFDEQGRVIETSVTQARTTLQEVSEAGVSLAANVLVEIAGKRLDAEPQVVKQGFCGEPSDQAILITPLDDTSLAIEGRAIPCHVEQMESTAGRSKTMMKTFWSPTVAPYILKREIVTTDPLGNSSSQSTIEVVALDVPCNVLGEMKSTATVKTVVSHPKGTTVTLSVTSVEVPGGVVCHTAKELDESGRLVRRSTLELVDYGLEPIGRRGGFFQRLREHRERRALRAAAPYAE